MSDWRSVAEKLSLIMSNKAYEIRREVPTDKIVDAAMQALVSAASAGPTIPINVPGGVANLPVEGLAAAISEINEMQTLMIRQEMSNLGIESVEEDCSSGDSGLVREEGSRLLVRSAGMTFSVDKEVALKVVSLGALP